MANQSQRYRQQYLDLLTAFESGFQGIAPPTPEWFALWLGKYGFHAILSEIQELQTHPLKSKFTTESIGRALSARLRDGALRHAITNQALDPQGSGGKS
jgi:hypothetical protein